MLCFEEYLLENTRGNSVEFLSGCLDKNCMMEVDEKLAGCGLTV